MSQAPKTGLLHGSFFLVLSDRGEVAADRGGEAKGQAPRSRSRAGALPAVQRLCDNWEWMTMEYVPPPETL